MADDDNSEDMFADLRARRKAAMEAMAEARASAGSVTALEEREYWDKCSSAMISLFELWLLTNSEAVKDSGSDDLVGVFARDCATLADELLDERRKRFGGVK